ncbi:unnamed protein product [Brachionus calyciflorus]|uniref:COMM domain-containing protein n=1 Tax=Brachionus calyciflorus TaxID=104777 RepID=A0A813RVK1_9BILA|nr:unnamed protein product [Brachionus calyciflorus]
MAVARVRHTVNPPLYPGGNCLALLGTLGSVKFFLEQIRDLPNSDILLKVLRTRKNDLKEIYMTRTSNLFDTYLKNFDWSLKMTASSDKFAKLNNLKCMLEFQTEKMLKETIQNSLKFELDKKQLDKLIQTLETIQNKFDVYESV